ncbi:MAG: hypothetical protein RBS80_15490 [Thermoguttaceae bacterium]|jgi:ribonuclease HII|nr:hypothetical protein [Thermoguttaceae bacterium]
MAFILGTDEAGFGPNLGPLVVTGTLWEVPDGVGEDDLYERLADAIVATLKQAVAHNGRRLVVADSKRLHQPGGGLRNLERGVLAALGLLGVHVDLWSEVWDALVPGSLDTLARIPWYAEYDEPVPVDAAAEEIAELAAHIPAALAACGVSLRRIASDAVFPARFNELVLLHDSKGAALSHLSLKLASQAIEDLGAGPITIVCDKHGGRNRYARLIEEYFPDWLVENHGEGRERSDYQLGPPHRRVRVCFRARAEACLPVALASMVSKYLRELAMRALNDFWCGKVPGLRPTAGYPVDAARFRSEIVEMQKALFIHDHVLWRSR